jgi:hypothetical protein
MSGLISGLVRRLKYGRPVVLVSGLPRSGTSMAMKMLEAGGLSVVQDGIRTADEDNPKGYYEDERVKDLAEMQDKSWLRNARGHVIKVVSSLIQYLPDENFYKVIFMRRDLDEVLASQAKMLDRRGEANQSDDDDMRSFYTQHLDKVQFQMRFRSYFDVLYMNYTDVLENPRREAERINAFLGQNLDVDAMSAVAVRSLERDRMESFAAST